MWLVDYVPKLLDFNSHARVGRDFSWHRCVFLRFNFNSHARVGRDGDVLLNWRITEISTHTPV